MTPCLFFKTNFGEKGRASFHHHVDDDDDDDDDEMTPSQSWAKTAAAFETLHTLSILTCSYGGESYPLTGI